MATEEGLIGLWKVISAETPPKRSFGSTGWLDRINRNPGGLTITSAGASGFLGVTNRLEVGVQVTVNRHILSRREDQLSFGQSSLFTLGYSGGCPGCPILLGPVSMPGQAIPQLRNITNNRLTGAAGYYPLLPWVNRRLQTGFGEVVVSGKYSFYSEARGNRASFAVRPWIGIPTHDSAGTLLNTGSQLGRVTGGFDFLASKNIGDAAGLNLNAGMAFFPNAKSGGITYVGTPNMIPLRFGVNIPRTTRLQVLSEITSEIFVGDGTQNTSFGAPNPVDGTIGVRGYWTPWLAMSAGYRHTLNQFGGDKHGFVFTISSSSMPVAPTPPVPVPPTLACSAETNRVLPGTVVRLRADASTTTGRTLNYVWAAPAGKVEGSGPEARFDTTGLAPGEYTITVRVNDGADGFADCTITVTVVEPPKPIPPKPPTISCTVDRSSVTAGEAVTFRATGNSPDNRPLTYSWSSRDGRISGSGQQVRLDTTNLPAGTYTASARVTDDRGLAADCSASTTVNAPPPVPVMSKLNQCSFKPNISRVDNVCKAVLDDVALRLQSDPDASGVVVGYSAAKERKGADLSAVRASNVKQYLVKDKGIAAGRVQVRGEATDASQVEIYLVPRGATYTGPGQAVTEKPTPQKPARRRTAAPKSAAKTTPAAEAPAAAPKKTTAAGKKTAGKTTGKKTAAKKKAEKKAEQK